MTIGMCGTYLGQMRNLYKLALLWLCAFPVSPNRRKEVVAEFILHLCKSDCLQELDGGNTSSSVAKGARCSCEECGALAAHQSKAVLCYIT